MEFALSRLVMKAVRKEQQDNSSNAYEEVMERDMRRGSNVIASYIVYKAEREKDRLRRLQGRICRHGNHDEEETEVRKD